MSTKLTDVLYGRQGGRFAGSTINYGETAMTELHRLRLAGIKAGTWPTWADDEWLAKAETAVRRGDTSGPAVRAMETAKAIRTANAKGRRAA